MPELRGCLLEAVCVEQVGSALDPNHCAQPGGSVALTSTEKCVHRALTEAVSGTLLPLAGPLEGELSNSLPHCHRDINP